MAMLHATPREHRSCFKVSAWDLSSNLEHGGYAHEDQHAEVHLGMDPFFPEFSRGVMHLLRIARFALGPSISCPSIKSTGFRRHYLLEYETKLL